MSSHSFNAHNSISGENREGVDNLIGYDQYIAFLFTMEITTNYSEFQYAMATLWIVFFC